MAIVYNASCIIRYKVALLRRGSRRLSRRNQNSQHKERQHAEVKIKSFIFKIQLVRQHHTTFSSITTV